MKKLALISLGIACASLAYDTSDCYKKWSLGVRGGIFPTWYTNKTSTQLDTQLDFGTDRAKILRSNHKSPTFFDQYTMPWFVQVEGSHTLHNECSKILVDAAYIQASGRNYSAGLIPEISDPTSPFSTLGTIEYDFKKFSMGQYRIGYRHQWILCNEYINPYLGFNVGLQNRFRQKFTFGITPTEGFDLDAFSDFPAIWGKSTIGVTGALHGGISLFKKSGFSINLHVEIVFSSPLKTNGLSPLLRDTEEEEKIELLFYPNAGGVLLSVPVALGISYSF